MKRKITGIFAASLAVMMLISGCDNNNNNGTPDTSTDNSQASVSDQTSSDAADEPGSKPTETRIVKSTDAGNSGEVKLEPGDTYAVITITNYGRITVKLFPEEAPYAVYNFVELAKKGTYNGRTFHRILEDFMAQGGSEDGKGSGGDSFDGGSFRNEINTSMRHYYGALCYASANGNISDQFYIVNNKKPQDDIKSNYQTYSDSMLETAAGYKGYMDVATKGTDEYYFYKSYYDFYYDYLCGLKAMNETVTDAVTEKYKNGGVPFLDGGYTVFGQTVDGFDVLDAISAAEKTTGSDGAQSKPVVDIIIDNIEILTK